MRMRTVLLCVAGAIVLAAICVLTPQIEVMLNEAGTEVLGVSFFKLTQPAIAQPAEERRQRKSIERGQTHQLPQRHLYGRLVDASLDLAGNGDWDADTHSSV